MEELNELVGLEKIKEDVNSLINLVKIRNIRKERGMSQTDLAIAVDTSRNVISKWEAGESAIRMDSFLRLCDELEVPPAAVIPKNNNETDELDFLYAQLKTLDPFKKQFVLKTINTLIKGLKAEDGA